MIENILTDISSALNRIAMALENQNNRLPITPMIDTSFLAPSLDRIAGSLESFHGSFAAAAAAASVAPAAAPVAAAAPAPKRGRPRKDATVEAPADPTVADQAPLPLPAAPTPAEGADVIHAPSVAPVTLDTVKQRLADITQNHPGAIEHIRNVLAAMGVARVSELDPGDYENFLSRLESLL